MKRFLYGSVGLALLVACGGGGGGQEPGTEGGPCYPNGTCNDGLDCVANVCVNPSNPLDVIGGTDVNDNGFSPTDNGEDTATDTTENTVFDGTYYIRSSKNVDAFFKYTEITGSLYVDQSDLKSFTLPNLQTVGIALQVTSNPTLISCQFPKLKTVGQRLDVKFNPALTSFEFPMLQTAEGLFVDGNTALESFEFPMLQDVSSHMGVGVFSRHKPNSTLVSFRFPLLINVGSIQISFNPALTTIEFPTLQKVENIHAFPKADGSYLKVWMNYSLKFFDFSALQTVTGNLWVDANTMLAQCLLDALIAQIQAADGIGGAIVTSGNNEDCTCEEVGGEVTATCP